MLVPVCVRHVLGEIPVQAVSDGSEDNRYLK